MTSENSHKPTEKACILVEIRWHSEWEACLMNERQTKKKKTKKRNNSLIINLIKFDNANLASFNLA